MAICVRFQPGDYTFMLEPGETVLEAGLRQGFRLLHACDNGVCQICRADLVEGQIERIAYQAEKKRPQAINDRSSQVLLCRAKPYTDCTFYFQGIRGPNELEAKTFAMQIQDIKPLTDAIYQVRLLAPAGSIPEFFAGQYLQLIIPGLNNAYFSIANAPGTRTVELHVEAQPGHVSAVAVMDYLRQQAVVKARLPMGNCFLSGVPRANVILIAAGTGFTQIKALAEYLHPQSAFEKELTFYWGVRRPSEMYARATAERWEQVRDNWHFVPVFADNPDNEWPGHHEELVKAVLADDHDWQQTLVFVSGSPTMVYTTLDALLPAGLPENHFFSDVLEYAPR